MGRRPQPAIKDALLDECIDYALAHGLPDRLGPLAAGTGTSARMLLYHFGTRDALLLEILHGARQRQLDAWGALLQRRTAEPYSVTLDRAWAAITGPNNAAFRQLFGLWQSSRAPELWPGFASRATTDWLGPLDDGLRSIGRPGLATVVLAVFRGLLLDIDTTADTARCDRAFREFLRMLEADEATAR